jgi:glyoxylase-like metal-dependent hydrolase (beta-lactamase superfamily II)
MCPWGQRLLSGEGRWLGTARLVCHVLLIEDAAGLILVDTGFGTQDVNDPQRLSRPFNTVVRPRLRMEDTALAQVRAAGFDPADVRHIVLTHLDLDHAGGLPDFPGASVHLSAREHATMLDPPLRERGRYRVAAVHWEHGPRWVPHEPGGDSWFGFESVRVIPDADDEIVLIPLYGHTLGHAGIAVRQGESWLLHCGDAYFNRNETATPPSCPPGLRAFQTLMQADGKQRRHNQERLQELARRPEADVELICAHDPEQLARAQAAG